MAFCVGTGAAMEEGGSEVRGRGGGVLEAGGLTSWSWVVEGDLVGERGFLGEGSARCGGRRSGSFLAGSVV